MRVAMYTLGCKMNQYETQAMEQLLRQRGHEIVPFTQEADAYVVNSCSVTAVSDQKSRQVLHRIRREHPEAVAALCGCYPQTGLGQRTRAMLKVEDGCVNFCSYCIIPYARGPVRSLQLETAAEQAANLMKDGYREIVLTGIEISSWGWDLKNGQTLIDLVEAVSAAAPGVRLRLGSLEPRTVTETFCRRAAALPALCPQFHLSLQSGCDETLRRMNRKYDTARFAHSVNLLNQYFDRPAITTDLICGFPEETEEEFAKTLAFIEKCGFAQMHIFPYSIRPGTPAEKLHQLPKKVKEDRARQVSSVAAAMRRSYLEGCVGQVYPVLFEQPRDGKFSGHAPNYMEVLVEGEGLHNVVRRVRITGTGGEALLGELLEDAE